MTASFHQDHFRVRTDATAAQGGTPVWAAAQDTNVSLAVNTNFRIRFSIDNTGTSLSQLKNLFASRNSGAFAQVTASTTFVQTVDATAGASAENSLITTQLLTGVGTFAGTGVYDDTGTTAAFMVSSGGCAECEFGIKITASASIGDTFDFEMFTNGVSFTSVGSGTYPQIPRITVVSGSIVLPTLYPCYI